MSQTLQLQLQYPHQADDSLVCRSNPSLVHSLIRTIVSSAMALQQSMDHQQLMNIMGIHSRTGRQEMDLFQDSGPSYLTLVRWDCPLYRRSAMASLVQGAYVLEQDRQWNRQGPDARAPAWWRFFHFELCQTLVDPADSSIFGAVYAFRPPCHLLDTAALAGAPRYVVAFRGTLIQKDSVLRDLVLDLELLLNCLEHSSRFRTAMETVRAVVESAAGHDRVWLAGHSLGSAVSTLCAKTMAREGFSLNTFLFNAPFLSAPLESYIPSKRVKQAIRVTKSVVTAGVATVLHRGTSDDVFSALARWVPNLFVNTADAISGEYVGYFNLREKMEDICLGAIGKLATMNSTMSLMTDIGKQRDFEPLHLFPSAVLTVNRGPSPDLTAAHRHRFLQCLKPKVDLEAHGISQWWRPDLDLEHDAYPCTWSEDDRS